MLRCLGPEWSLGFYELSRVYFGWTLHRVLQDLLIPFEWSAPYSELDSRILKLSGWKKKISMAPARALGRLWVMKETVVVK